MQVIVGAGLMGGLALGLLKMSEMQTRSIGHFSSRTEMNETYRRLTTFLLDNDICTQSIVASGINNDDFKVKTRDGSQTLMESGDRINNVIEIVSISSKESIPPEEFPGYGFLSIDLAMTPLAREDERVTNLQTLLRVRYDEHGDIEGCFSDDNTIILTSLQEMCKMLGGVTTMSHGECVLSTDCFEDDEKRPASLYCLDRTRQKVDLRGKECPSGLFMAGIRDDGTLICNAPPVL